MSNSSRVLKGILHGKTIELEQAPGLPDGQAVQIELRPLETATAWLDRIVVDPTVPPGQPIIKGTRIPAEELVALLEQGRSGEELRQTYPDLTAEDIAAVRQYALVPLGLRRSFGAWAEEREELDKYLEWNRQRRQIGLMQMTHNTQDYANIPGLNLDDWLVP